MTDKTVFIDKVESWYDDIPEVLSIYNDNIANVLKSSSTIEIPIDIESAAKIFNEKIVKRDFNSIRMSFDKLEELKHTFNIVEKKNVPKELRFYGKSHTLVLGKRHYDMMREHKDVEFDITLYDTYDTHPFIDSLTKPETIQREKRWFDIQFPKVLTTLSIDNDITDNSSKAWVFKNITHEYVKTCQIPYRFIFSDANGFNSYSIDENTSINNAINYLSTNGIDKPFILGVELDSRLFKTDFNAKLFLLAQCCNLPFIPSFVFACGWHRNIEIIDEQHKELPYSHIDDFNTLFNNKLIIATDTLK